MERLLALTVGPYRLALPVTAMRQIVAMEDGSLDVSTRLISLSSVLQVDAEASDTAVLVFEQKNENIYLSAQIIGGILDASEIVPLPDTVVTEHPELILGTVESKGTLVYRIDPDVLLSLSQKWAQSHPAADAPVLERTVLERTVLERTVLERTIVERSDRPVAEPQNAEENTEASRDVPDPFGSPVPVSIEAEDRIHAKTSPEVQQKLEVSVPDPFAQPVNDPFASQRAEETTEDSENTTGSLQDLPSGASLQTPLQEMNPFESTPPNPFESEESLAVNDEEKS